MVLSGHVVEFPQTLLREDATVDVDGVLAALELGENAEVALMRGWKQDESVLSKSKAFRNEVH